MKASRLLSILMLLQTHGRMSGAALAQAMEVSPRTILRDIDQLSAAGVPLWGERGRLGGYQLRPGWSTQLTGMTEPEANALLLAGLPSAATELGLGSAAASARLKLVASLPPPWREQAARVGERLHIDPVDWYQVQDAPQFLRKAAESVWQGRRIQVRYKSWRKTSNRELEPLGLVMKAGAWYLAAREVGREPVRTYRLASVLELKTSTRAFKRPRNFDLARYWQESAVRFEAELRPIQARIRVSPWAMECLRHMRLRFTPCPPGSGSGPARPGWKDVLLPIESIEEGARQMLGYGGEVEVIQPVELRRCVADLATRVLALHGFLARSPVEIPPGRSTTA